MIGSPGTDLHSPGAIGDVAPSTIAGTTISATVSIRAPKVLNSAGATLTFSDTPGSAGLSIDETSGSSILRIHVDGSARWVMNGSVFQAAGDNNYFASGLVGTNSVAAYGNRLDGGAGLGFPTSTTTCLQAGGEFILTVSGTLVTIRSGVPLKLGSTAAAEVVVASHTITIQDATGTSYKLLAVPA